MLKRESCTKCKAKISSFDINDGLAREVEEKFYCRKCILDLGLLIRRGVETEEFLDGVKGVLGDVELTPQETLMVERKTRKQVANVMDKIMETLQKHPSWDRDQIIEYLKTLTK